MAKIGTTVSRLTCRSIPHEMSGQVCIWSDVILGPLQLKKSSGHGKMIDPHVRLLHHKTPFTQEGNYLVNKF